MPERRPTQWSQERVEFERAQRHVLPVEPVDTQVRIDQIRFLLLDQLYLSDENNNVVKSKSW